MERKGRDFEDVVKLIEETIAGEGIEIKSPDYIPDKDTGQPREVDVSLRGKIGSSNLLVIIESRDRIRDPPQDVIWIEQLACKQDSVGADKVIAVSSKGFTEPAEKKAQKNGIELRTFEEIDPEEVRRWFFPSGPIYHHRQMKEAIVNIQCNNPKKLKEEFPKGIINWQAPIFILKGSGEPESLDTIWSRHAREIYSNVPEDGTKIRSRINLDIAQLLTKSGPIEMKSIGIDAILWIEAEKIYPTVTRAYKKGDETLAKTQEFELEIVKGEKLSLVFCGLEASGKHNIGVRRKVIMNSETVLAVLPDSKDDALSMNEIALAMGLDISSYTAMGRTKRQLSRTLRSLIKWGYVDCDRRQGKDGLRAWHNAYWKTELAGSI